MSDYRMVGGMVTFVVVVLAILIPASQEYPEIIPNAPDNFPPDAPSFALPAWTPQANVECNLVTFCVNVIAHWITVFFGIVVGGLVFIVGLLAAIVGFFAGLLSFSILGLPPELEWINTLLTVTTLFVIVLFLFRLIRSIIPFVSGE